MASFSGLAIALSLVFGFLLLALIAELYYLLFLKKRVTNTEIEESEYSSNYAKEFLHLICFKKTDSLPAVNNQEGNNCEDPDLEIGKDLVIKGCEESVDSELMRLHNLSGPPRFLFTIKEETKEELESQDGKSRRGSRTRSLSDVLLTPLASPRLINPLDSYHNHGFNPLFESSIGEEAANKLRSSPPPKFKFMRDAEEKLLRKLMREATEDKGVKEGSFLGFIVPKNKGKQQCPSQVLQSLSTL